ncbi:arsenate reductase (glutaredoxin) [Crocinitomicaceae bacterium]|nr:arsenate reductase (glutaredoxin) [Crocinitomicaceae bacterium]MDC1196210.1 arsenate reductase (glutaredoxin) [Crocinitomicaceae bacterium]MDC1282718.1 arsenate reductase (glutaredoxin) [Crocinitomicaceae bacterium]MDC1385754.1 arsenate reductase (glutaredoxin) [Crocinitomicaceae bacterium]
MSDYIVYHNPRCSKSRMALVYLEEANKEYRVIEYLKESPTKVDLETVLIKLGIPAEGLVRKGEPGFKEHFKGKTLSENEWIDAMLKYPKLIERPIVVLGNKAVIARPIEKIDDLN